MTIGTKEYYCYSVYVPVDTAVYGLLVLKNPFLAKKERKQWGIIILSNQVIFIPSTF